MFEYRDNFLMDPTVDPKHGEGSRHLCNASNTAEDQLADLDRPVGADDRHERSAPDVPVEAPGLDFDLEGELTHAFEERQAAAETLADEIPIDIPKLPVRNPIEMAFATQAEPEAPEPVEVQQAPAPPEPVQTAETPKEPVAPPEAPVVAKASEPVVVEDAPGMDFSDMIAEELDKALADEIAADPTLSQPLAMPEEAAAVGEELDRLMGGDKVTTAPPAPEVAQAPWEEAKVVKAPEIPMALPGTEETASESATQWQPAQTSDFTEPMPDFTDPAAEFHDYVQPTSGSEEPSLPTLQPEKNSHLDKVLGGAAALGAAAIATTVGQPEADAEMAAAGQLNTPFPSFDVDDEPLTVPEASAIAAGGQSRGGGGKRAALAIVAVALFGGAAAFAWNFVGGDSGPAPTILASNEPVKVKPTDAGGKIVPNQDQAVYQSVEKKTAEATKQAKLTDQTEKPMDVSTKPTPQKTETQVAGTDATTTGGLVLKPRRVRTVVVKPDGTIVSVGGAEPAAPVSGIEVKTPTLSLQPATASGDPIAPTKVAEPKSIDVAKLTPKPAKVQPVKVKSQAKAASKKVAAPKPVKKRVTPKPVAKVKPAAKTAGLPSVKSAFAVQIASQRSADAAQRSYASLSRKYASLLRGKGVDIRKGVIKGKGTYFRVRIPAKSKGAANKLCGQLKAKGGACFVTR